MPLLCHNLSGIIMVLSWMVLPSSEPVHLPNVAKEDGFQCASVATQHPRQGFDRDAEGGAPGTGGVRNQGNQGQNFRAASDFQCSCFAKVKSILNKLPGKHVNTGLFRTLRSCKKGGLRWLAAGSPLARGLEECHAMRPEAYMGQV